MNVGRFATLAMVLAATNACGSGSAISAAPSPAPVPTQTARSTADTIADLIPANFGTLRQEDLSIVLQAEGVRITTLPLDESVIRALAPDSYRSFHAILESKRREIAQRASAHAMRTPRVWFVQFYGLAPDARFVPSDVTISSSGRDLRPFDVIPITGDFGTQRLQPRMTQTGLLLFDERLDISQPLTVIMGAERNSDWESILRRLDTERAAIRARAAARPSPSTP